MPVMALLLLLLPALVTAQASARPCKGAAGNGVIGYTTIADMDADQQAEKRRIIDGGIPNSPYVFTICPGTALDLTAAPLIPVLDGSIFTCGNEGTPDADCMFVAGETQVLVENSDVRGYPFRQVEFRGITFTAFTNAAIAGGASALTTLVLRNVVFEVCTGVESVE
jgi:hypothetical protein